MTVVGADRAARDGSAPGDASGHPAARGLRAADHVLHYDTPAADWTEGLPLGNGRQGAMVLGPPLRQRLQLNDSTAWSGSPASEDLAPLATAQDAAASLGRARDLIAGGDPASATAPLQRLQHRHSQSYQPLADVWVATSVAGAARVGTGRVEDLATGYRRELDLRTAVHESSYQLAGHRVRHRSWASRVHDVIVHEIDADAPEGVDLDVSLSSPQRVLDLAPLASGVAPGSTPGSLPGPAPGSLPGSLPGSARGLSMTLQLPSDVPPTIDAGPEGIAWDDTPGASLRAAVVLGWRHDGDEGVSERADVQADGRESSPRVVARGVHSAQIVVATATTFAGLGAMPQGSAHEAAVRAQGMVEGALAADTDAERADTSRAHALLYERTELSLEQPATGSAAPAAPAELPIDARLLAANQHPLGPAAADPALIGVLFNLGRYLAISSTRPGSPPPNLQGIWNQDIQPAWSSNYTININLQMNYWMAEVANLPELTPPLFDLIDALAARGAETARRLYGASGWVAHHNADIWAYTHPVGGGSHDPCWAFWPWGGVWLVQHLRDHLEFGARTADSVLAFAADRAFEPTRSAAAFVLDWLVELPDGSLGTRPSTSPENHFAAPDGRVASAGSTSAMDLQLARDLFEQLQVLAELTGRRDDDVTSRAREALARLAVPELGARGQVREWVEDPPETEPSHRHLSHLYFAYPGTTDLDESAAAAVSRSLDLRGDESTGWGLAWRVALRARLRQPDAVSRLLSLAMRTMTTDRGHLSGGLYPNLFTAHPPFQIDANFGLVAALAECLLASHREEVELLPSVPDELASGDVRGLVARPGIVVDIAWRPGPDGHAELVSARLATARPGEQALEVRVRYRDSVVDITLGPEPVTLAATAF